MKLLEHPTLTWGFKAEADPGTNGRAINYPRGRVLGGSSSINGMIYVRGQPEDFDHWGQLGNRGWSWDDVLPFFRKAENWEGKEDAVHGKGGPLFTSHGRDKPLLCQAAVEAAKQLGCEYREDVNDLPPGAGDGIGWVQQTRGGRRRASSARSYLRPALKRPNLQVITGALVHRVLFDGTRAVGVEYLAQRQYRARRCRGRGDPGGRRDRFAAYPATVRCRRSRASRSRRHPCASRTARRRAQPAGPLSGARVVLGAGRAEPEPAIARAGTGRPGAALSRHRQRHPDLCGVAGRRVGEGAAGIGDARRAGAVRARQLRRGRVAPAGHDTGHDLRHVADATAEPRLCRGALAASAGAADHQPALLQRRDRLPRRGRRDAMDPQDVRRAGAGANTSSRRPCPARTCRATTSCCTT